MKGLNGVSKNAVNDALLVYGSILDQQMMNFQGQITLFCSTNFPVLYTVVTATSPTRRRNANPVGFREAVDVIRVMSE